MDSIVVYWDVKDSCHQKCTEKEQYHNNVFIHVCFSAVYIILWSFVYSFALLTFHGYNYYMYESTMWQAPNWLDSLVGRALHWYHRGQGFESHSGLNFFQAFFSGIVCINTMINMSSCFSTVQIYDLSYIHMH